MKAILQHSIMKSLNEAVVLRKEACDTQLTYDDVAASWGTQTATANVSAVNIEGNSLRLHC